jgi:hypothetical protein
MRGAFLEPRDSPFIAVQEMLSAKQHMQDFEPRDGQIALSSSKTFLRYLRMCSEVHILGAACTVDLLSQ